ncbi:MAG: undecaprenyl-diphosphatase UppP [Patescibacteria group bacterium]|jgi:undecaprenyl-diphosphatase
MDTGTLWHFGQAVILGLIQGVTEFLPISSSGHLIIAREFLRINDPGNFFDAILHLATLLAILVYFWRDWWQMLLLAKTKKESKTGLPIDRRLLRLIIIATLPGLLVGYWGNHWIEDHWRSLLSVAILLVVTGLGYLLFESKMKLAKASKILNYWDALSIGLTQALAILPGISRSGMTLLGGMYAGLTRATAARLSFLLAAPIIAAAGGYGLYQSLHQSSPSYDISFLAVAFIFSFTSGLLAIRWLLQFYQKHSLKGFAIYLLIVGTGLIVYSFLK